MNFFKIPFALIALFFVVAGNQACKQGITDYDREKVFLDSLNTQLLAIEVALNIDEQELQNRIAFINTWYVKLNDTAYEVAKKMQADFTGFKVVYTKYIDNFFVYETQNELLKKQYAALEDKVKNKSITREAFKTEYFALKQEIMLLYKGATTLAQPVYDLEFSWKRYYKEMMAMR